MDITTKKKQPSQSDEYFNYKFFIVLCVTSVFSYLAWYAYNTQVVRVDPKSLPIIKLNRQIKFKPETPGGIEIANLDKGIYDYISGRTNSKSVVASYAKEEPLSKKEILAIVNNKLDRSSDKFIKMTKKSAEVVDEPKSDAMPEASIQTVQDQVIEKKLEIAPKVSVAQKSDAVPKASIQTPKSKVYYIRIAKINSPKMYDKAWKIMTTKYSAILGTLKGKLHIEKKNGKEAYYLHAGPLNSESQASALCKKMISSGGNCTLSN